MSPRPLNELVSPDWADALQPVAATITAMGAFLRAELAAGRQYLPAGEHVLRAFTRPLSQVKILIVGQDPYPTPGHPVGLSFSVASDVRPIPRSLQNIYQELGTDLGPGVYRLVFHPPSRFFRRVELEVELGDGHTHVPLIFSSYACASYRGS